jgi:hypothetical protein
MGRPTNELISMKFAARFCTEAVGSYFILDRAYVIERATTLAD